MIIEDDPGFFQHYGKKGMRWGVRKARSGGVTTGKTAYKKPPARLNDAELNRRIKRLEAEKKYSELNLSASNPGKAYVNGIMNNSGKMAAGAVVSGVVGFAVQQALKKAFSK